MCVVVCLFFFFFFVILPSQNFCVRPLRILLKGSGGNEGIILFLFFSFFLFQTSDVGYLRLERLKKIG